MTSKKYILSVKENNKSHSLVYNTKDQSLHYELHEKIKSWNFFKKQTFYFAVSKKYRFNEKSQEEFASALETQDFQKALELVKTQEPDGHNMYNGKLIPAEHPTRYFLHKYIETQQLIQDRNNNCCMRICSNSNQGVVFNSEESTSEVNNRV